MAKCYFAQIVHAISYCHGLHVVHRDLKPENVVFFEKQGVVKLTDFGFSNRFQPGKALSTSCGSLAYSAPEILLGDEYDAPAVGEPPSRRLPGSQVQRRAGPRFRNSEADGAAGRSKFTSCQRTRRFGNMNLTCRVCSSFLPQGSIH